MPDSGGGKFPASQKATGIDYAEQANWAAFKGTRWSSGKLRAEMPSTSVVVLTLR
jgi:hypothetical protein